MSDGGGVGDIEIRRAARDDVAAINLLIGASVRGLSTGLYSTEQIELALANVFGVDTQLVDDGTYFVVEANGELAAAGGWSARLTLHGGDQAKAADDPLVDPATSPARIRAFFVDPRFARRGIARRLFEKCKAAARDRGFTRLVLVATLPGVPLYTALGFTPAESVDVPMPGGITLPCIHMERPIDSQ
ncbi:MAG: GNAT family N-acetyltransferase [Gemmatimonadaceae bacterium]